MAVGSTKPGRRSPRRNSPSRVAIGSTGLALLGCLLGTGGTFALDQPVAARKLWLRDSPKLVILSNDPGIDVGGAQPTCPSGVGRVRCTAPPTSSSSSGNFRRACACQ